MKKLNFGIKMHIILFCNTYNIILIVVPEDGGFFVLTNETL